MGGYKDYRGDGSSKEELVRENRKKRWMESNGYVRGTVQCCALIRNESVTQLHESRVVSDQDQQSTIAFIKDLELERIVGMPLFCDKSLTPTPLTWGSWVLE